MLRRYWSIALVALACVATSFAQKAEPLVAYNAPSGWPHDPQQPKAHIYNSPDGEAQFRLYVDFKGRPALELVNGLSESLSTTLKDAKVTSTAAFSIADQPGTRLEMEATLAVKKAMRYRFILIAVTAHEYTAVITCSAPVKKFDRYAQDFDKAIQSVRLQFTDAVAQAATPTAPAATNYSSNELGMKMKLEPGWKLKSEAPGQYSGTPKSTFVPESGDAAMVALAMDAKPHSHQDHVDFVLQNTRAQSTSVEILGRKDVTFAGLPGTRLDLVTQSPSGAKFHRVIYIVSRDGHHYVAAAVAVTGADYDKYAEPMQRMIDSVQLMAR